VTRDGVEDHDGCVSRDGLIVGTYVHGLLENATLRRAMLRSLARRKGVVLPGGDAPATVEQAIEALADSVAANLDLDAIARMVERPLHALR
jgi:adenosylcobyric acid synthase